MQRFQLNTLSCSAVVMTLLFSGCAAKDTPVDKSLQEKEKVLTEAIEEKVEILEYSPPVYESSIDDGTFITDGTLLIKDNCLVVQHDIKFFGERSRESALVFSKNTTRFSNNVVLRQNSSYGVLLYQSSQLREYKIGEGYRFPGLASTIDDERIKPQPKCQLDNVWFVT